MSNLSEITAAILAGGFGTRLQTVVKGKPKVLVKIRKHSFLEYLLNQLNQSNFKKIVICAGYLGNQIKETFGESYKNLNILYSQELSPLGTAGALRKALPTMRSDSVLVMNGDSYCDVSIKSFWDFYSDKKAKAGLVLSYASDTSHYGRVKIDKEDNIVGFEEKQEGSGAGLINAGIYLINKSLIKEIPQNKEVSIEKDVFPKWIGQSFYGYKSNGRFIDIGTAENYAGAEQFFSQYEL